MTTGVNEAPEAGKKKSGFGGNVAKNVVASVVTAALIGGYAEWRRIDSDRIRKNIQGVWVLETHTVETTFAAYRDMTVVFLVTVTVDSNYNVTGVAYKLRERGPKVDVTYERDKRARGQVSGSIIRDRVVLNWESLDSGGRPSLQTFEGDVTVHGDVGMLRGRFLSDVAEQGGTFCGRRILLEARGDSGVIGPFLAGTTPVCP